MTRWVCSQCEPPPSLVMVSEEIGVPKIASEFAYCLEVEACPKCHGRMVIERTWTDGMISLQCISCGYDFDAVDTADAFAAEARRIELYRTWRSQTGSAVPGIVKFKSDQWITAAMKLIVARCATWRNGRLVADESKWHQTVEAYRSELVACDLI